MASLGEWISEAVLKFNEGTVYSSFMRLHQSGLIRSSWGTLENNRSATGLYNHQAREAAIVGRDRELEPDCRVIG